MTRTSRLRFSLIVLAAATLGVLVSSDAPLAADAPVSLHEQTFIDRDGALAFSIQLDPAAVDAGHWTFRVNGIGVYTGNAGGAMELRSRRRVEIDFRGPATLRTLGSGGSASPRQVRLDSRIDPELHIAEAELRDGKDRFELHARPADVAGLETTVSTVEKAIVANDPAAIYSTLNAQAVRAYTQAAFIATWNTESAARGRITGLRRLSLGQPQVNDQGFSFVSAEYSVDFVGPSGPGTAWFTAFFIHEPGGWKFWTTVRR